MRRRVRSSRADFRWTACLLGALCVAMPACTSAPDSSTNERPENIEAVFAEYAVDGSPGAVAMVIEDGEVVHAAGYGAANVESGAALERTTPVRLGSVSKAFTAMAIVILEERGDLEFDALASRWIPEIARFGGITVRHLLNHTSGLPDYYEGSPLGAMATASDRVAPLQNAEAMAVYETWGQPLFPPGDRFEYSNPGYEALALIVERISGQTFGQFLNAEIFGPLGMSTAAVRELPRTVISDRAIGYVRDRDGVWHEDDDHWGNWLVGAGGVYASLDDLYQWDQALHRWAESGERTGEAFGAARLNDGTESLYGFAWNLSDRLGRPAIHHGGSWVGFRTAFVRFPADALTVVVLSNATGPADEFADAIARLYLDDA